MIELVEFLKADRRGRFLLAGGAAAGVNWLARFPLAEFMPFVFAVAAANLIGMAFAFLIYRHFVFSGSNRSVLVMLRDFMLVNAVGALVAIVSAVIIRYLLLTVLPPNWMIDAGAHAAGIAIGAVVNYFGHSRLTFRTAQ